MSGARRLVVRRAGNLSWRFGVLFLAIALPVRGADEAGWTPLPDALRATLQTGRPTVVVVTGTDAGSQQLRSALPGILQTQAIGGLVQLAEMPAAEHAERLRQMQVAVVPTALVYVRGDNGLALADYKQGLADPYQLVGWLSGVKLPSPAPAASPQPADAQVQRTGYPTPQGQTPTPQAPPPQYAPPQPPAQAPPPPVYSQPVQVPPVVTAPAPVPALVSPPAQTFVVQPQPATLVMAPAPQPNIILAGSAPSAPTVSYAAPAPALAAAPPVNLMTQPAPAAPAPAAAAPVTYAMAPTYAQAPAVAQAPVGQGPVTTALITMVAPSLLESILGVIGNRLRRHGLPRMEVGQAPVVNTVAGNLAAPAPGYAPAAPAPAYPQVGYVPVGPPYAMEAPHYPVPSAQGHPHHAPAAPQKRGLFGH